MHNSSFDIPNQQGAREHSEEPNLETGEGLEAGELGLEAREFNCRAEEVNIGAREFDFEAENTNIPTPVLNPEETYQDYHLELNGQICDEHGQFIHPDAPPPPFTSRECGDWTPFRDCTEFETADDIDKLMYLWGQTLVHHRDTPPFSDHKDLYSTIDAIPLGEVPWESFTMKFNGEGSVPSDSDLEACPLWMDTPYTAWFQDPHAMICNMLANPDFKDEMEYVPYCEWKGEEGDTKQQWHNVMSGDWAWNQAVSSLLLNI
ncbi:hypothetical protein BDR03DRAFT_983111 [Suillus americanus]|nr:hypothetical protein BDR03DRAFT_983111 [Suillus americanus]